jgi:The GLUG motif
MKSTGKWLRGSTGTCVLGMAVSAGLLAAPAEARLTISSAPTKNMTCSAGVCSPTQTTAVLNVADLKRMLKSRNMTVTTTGSGSVQANDIVVATALAWSSANTLTLTALQNITVISPISVTGKGGLTLNDGGRESLAFYNGANVTFSNLSSALTINGNAYVLFGTVAEFASDVSANQYANQNGYFALAANYDASGDGTYSSAPVQGDNASGGMNGVFEGLGNTISNLSIVDGSCGCDGLIAFAPQETISNFGMVNVSISGNGTAGGIVSYINSNGLIWRSYATGAISMGFLDSAGGLEAGNAPIAQSWANVAISGGQGLVAGGLTTGGSNQIIEQSFSMGPVSCSVGYCDLGGLALAVGQGGQVTDSYSIGAVTDGGTGGDDSYVGGLLSGNGGGTIENSYAAGKVTTPDSGCVNNMDCVGGLYGMDNYNSNKHAYWDTTTTGWNVAAGNESTDPGTKGLKNKTFVAQLPRGFSPRVWAENPNINGGLPYLIANPPPN